MKKIAIIGSGVSGLTAGYLLSREHEVSIFEANDYLGGHTATVDVEIDNKPIAVDTGFIVCNDRTYPNFLKLLDKIGVNKKETQMSFSVHNDANGLEYNGHNLSTLFAQKKNFFSLKFLKFISEILRFNKLAREAAAKSSATETDTLGDFLDRHNFNQYFANNYILAMVAAIWSSSLEDTKDFPLKFFLNFFTNHGLLEIKNRPQWYVIENGSRSYIPHLTQPIKNIYLSSPVEWVKRTNGGVILSVKNQEMSFDDVIFACHSDQALSLMIDATEAEKSVLGNMHYRPNEVVLHTDTNLLPKAKQAWASWNYWIDSNTSDLPCVTYNMNILQGFKMDTTLCVTLNQTSAIEPDKILRKFTYSHPVFTTESLAAQGRRSEICGLNHTHFCGAYWYNGFHEDGVKSALDVCKRFGQSL